MIDSFIEFWAFFGDMYLAGMGSAILLSLIGIYFVARNQIFSGAAIAQASTLGMALSLLYHLDSDVLSILIAAVVCWLMLIGDRVLKKSSGERFVGWTFLFCSSLSILLVSNSPHSLEEVKSLMSSGLIHATQGDAIVFWCSSVFVTVLIIIFYRKLILFMTDVGMARSVGFNVIWWVTIISLIIGVCMGTTIQSTGMLFSFSCLILPAMIAQNICKSTRSIFIVSPIIALCAVLISFVLANHYDKPFDQTACIFLCGLSLLSWAIRFVMKLRSYK